MLTAGREENRMEIFLRPLVRFLPSVSSACLLDIGASAWYIRVTSVKNKK